MRNIFALFHVILLSTGSPLVASVATVSGPILISGTSAKAQILDEARKNAQDITVRIEGATQGSGVLVKREENRYIVLTAWHVVSGQRPGEELDIHTVHGKSYPVQEGSIQRVMGVDMAILTFSSNENYKTARIDSSSKTIRGTKTLVAGFPRSKPGSIMISDGVIVANADMGIDSGYQLIYTSHTETGMSGGPVLDASGNLIAIHGRGELDIFTSSLASKTIKTGANQAVPIQLFTKSLKPESSQAIANAPQTADDYIAQVRSILVSEEVAESVRHRTAEKLLSKAIDLHKSPVAYQYRGAIRFHLNNTKGGTEDLETSLKLNPDDLRTLGGLAEAYRLSGRKDDALKLLVAELVNSNKPIVVDDSFLLSSLLDAMVQMGDAPNALNLANKALSISPRNADLLGQRAVIKKHMGNTSGAISDFMEAAKYGSPVSAEIKVMPLMQSSQGINSVIAYYDRLIKRDPSNVSHYYYRAFSRLEAGDKDGFYDDSIRAFNLSAKKTEDYLTLGKAKLELGDKSGAQRELAVAIRLLEK